ncbi:carbonic anhydrase [Polyangium spumosum]|uniref:carbonic anhydrase n=1 Tax=Polyangium spumosum TaxID=889282 RepID=A0A6N7PUU1_9BACT|nr:carbonic anhydrase [Polyangium spumosum]MRG95753.1 carbonic anhydrase [Polyangium spumosum]
MEKLLRGIIDFRKNKRPGLLDLFRNLAEKGQKPDVLFFACADSRVVPNLVVSTDPGDLFVVRSVGNLVAPASSEGVSVADVSEASAIEYSINHLPVKHIVVCGHSHCGAMGAVLAGRDKLKGVPNLKEWLSHAEPSFARLVRSPFIKNELPPADRLSQANVLQQIDHILTYPGISERVAQGTLMLHAWWFDVPNADVHVYDRERGGYTLLDEAEADRVLSGRSGIRPS